MMIHKKAAFQLSVDFIVIIILALFFISLGVSFIKSNIEKSQIRLEEAMVAGAPKPNVEIRSPQNNYITLVGEEVNFEPFVYSLKSEVVGYFWDFDGDGSFDSRKEEDTHTYYEIGDYNATLKVLNELGGVGTASVIVRVFTKNEKDLENKYIGNPVFFIPSIPSGNDEIEIDNWQEILKVIPLTRWYDQQGDHKYDFVAIAKKDSQQITWQDIKGKLDELDKTNAVVFDMGLSDEEVDQANSEGYTIVEESTSDIGSYFSYWKADYDNVVLISNNNFDGALIGSLFAAYSNSPLVFIDQNNYLDYEDYLFGRKIYIIDELPDDVLDAVLAWSSDNTPYGSEEDLRQGNVNRILELTSKVFVKETAE